MKDFAFLEYGTLPRLRIASNGLGVAPSRLLTKQKQRTDLFGTLFFYAYRD